MWLLKHMVKIVLFKNIVLLLDSCSFQTSSASLWWPKPRSRKELFWLQTCWQWRWQSPWGSRLRTFSSWSVIPWWRTWKRTRALRLSWWTAMGRKPNVDFANCHWGVWQIYSLINSVILENQELSVYDHTTAVWMLVRKMVYLLVVSKTVRRHLKAYFFHQ